MFRTTTIKFKTTALVCALMCGLFPLIQHAHAEQLAQQMVEEALTKFWTLTDTVDHLARQGLVVHRTGIADWEVVLASGARIHVAGLEVVKNNAMATFTSQVSVFDSEGQLALESDELSVSRLRSQPNMIEGFGVIKGGDSRFEPAELSLQIIGTARMQAITVFTGNEIGPRTFITDFSGLDPNLANNEANNEKVSDFGITLTETSMAGDGLRFDPTTTPAIVGLGAPILVAALIIVAILGCVWGWWCEAVPPIYRRDGDLREISRGLHAPALLPVPCLL